MLNMANTQAYKPFCCVSATDKKAGLKSITKCLFTRVVGLVGTDPLCNWRFRCGNNV